MITDINKGHQLNENSRNTTNKGNSQRSPSTFKRHLTNHSTLGDDARYLNNKRQRQNSQDNIDKVYDNDERFGEWTDPNIRNSISFNDNQGDNDNNQTHISNQAVNYATDCHFPPIKIICTPKMQNQNGAYFVQTPQVEHSGPRIP
ncbi:unnamed protein product [Rotaria magnacalcarata]|nr:unnamed protein product [Rotaria magnacalcarata]